MIAATSGAQLWQTIAAWVTVGIYVFVAGFAWVQIRDSRRTRREETRPYVFVDLEADRSIFYFTIQNVGRTAAKNVRFSCEPPLASTLDSGGGHRGPLTKTWPFFPPNKEVRAVFDSAIARLNSSALPFRYAVTAEYESALTNEPYRDTFVLDMDTYRGRMSIGQKSMNELVKAIEDIRNLLGTGDGLHIVAQDYEDWKREREEGPTEDSPTTTHLAADDGD